MMARKAMWSVFRSSGEARGGGGARMRGEVSSSSVSRLADKSDGSLQYSKRYDTSVHRY